jgi:CRP-like cAMP-binding protein
VFNGISNGPRSRTGIATKPAGFQCGNLLLDALPYEDRANLAGDLKIISIPAHTYTHSAGMTMTAIDFPIDAVLSVVATLENGYTIEVGTVGRESFVEVDAALSSPRSQRSSFCQVRGSIGRMPFQTFEHRMATSPSFATLIHRNVRAALFSAQQFAACNSKHSVLQRCARWLSMTEDRVGDRNFTLTHELLAVMLGVRRAGVSQAAEALRTMGAIDYRRGRITVLDSALLNATACECYDACKRAFASSLE